MISRYEEKKHKNGISPIVLVVVAIIALGIGYLLARKNNDKGSNTVSNTEEQTETVAKTRMIEETSEKVEETMVKELNEEFLVNNIEALNNGMAQGIFKQVKFGENAAYCLNNDGTITVYTIEEDYNLEKRNEYSSWNNIVGIEVVNSRGGDRESIIGLRDDGTVAVAAGTEVGRFKIVDFSGWKDIKWIDTVDSDDLLGLTSEGKFFSTYDNHISDVDFLKDINCKKVVCAWGVDLSVIGLLPDGSLVSSDAYPYMYMSLSGLKDMVVLSNNEFFGLTEDGHVVFGGNVVSDSSNSEYVDLNLIKELVDIRAIDAGINHLVALRSDGTVVALGNNSRGQCNVGEWKDIVRVEAFGNTTIGYASDGRVYYTGYNCLEDALKELQTNPS